MKARLTLLGIAGAIALACGLAVAPQEASAQCSTSVFARHPCTPGFGSVLNHHPYTPGFCGIHSAPGCIPYGNYPLNQVPVLHVQGHVGPLAPLDRNVQAARNTVVFGAGPQDAPPNQQVLEESVKNSPDDFRSVQRLDYAMAKQGGRFGEIVELWNSYLSRHPNDGQAYLERGGAYYHWGKLAEAGSDAKKACELGITEGCARAKQLGL